MTWTECVVDLLFRTSSIVVIGIVVVTGLAMALGIGVQSADRLLDAREWMRALGDCLRSI